MSNLSNVIFSASFIVLFVCWGLTIRGWAKFIKLYRKCRDDLSKSNDNFDEALKLLDELFEISNSSLKREQTWKLLYEQERDKNNEQ